MRRDKEVLIIAIFAMTAFAANAILPRIELRPFWMRVTDLERTDSATRVSVRFQNIPGNWVRFNSTGRLIAEGDTTLQYKLIGTENIELDSEIWISETGRHEGVLIFEKVPKSVKKVDLVEIDPADTPNNIIGIHLDEPETRLRPKTMSLDDIIGNGKKANEQWTGLDPSKYSDLPFYNAEGKAHIKGKITDYSPRCGFKNVSLITYEDFTGRQFPHSVSVAPDGSFAMDVDIRYPQFTSLDFGESHTNSFLIPDGERHNYICLIPGDTISISTCVASRPDRNKGIVPEYFGFEGTPTESTTISLLADSLINKRYRFDSLFWDYFVPDSYSQETETIKATEGLCQMLDSVVEDLPVLLGDLPVSNFAKDVLSSYAVGQIELLMEQLEMHLRLNRTSIIRREDGTLFESLRKYDINAITAPKLRHKDLIFDNPLILCNSYILPKRWEDNELLKHAKWAARGMMESSVGGSFLGVSNLSQPFDVSIRHLDSIGIGTCFAAQLIQTKAYIENLYSLKASADNLLRWNSRMLPQIFRHNPSEKMNMIIMNEYNDFVKNLMIAEIEAAGYDRHTTVIEGIGDGDILEKIISPYRGNVLYLDFWGMSCAPCRAGMVRQKPILSELSGKPFRALYIANMEDGVENCITWMNKEGIKGEHVFVSDGAWQALRKLFNINGIPFGLLIDKDGTVIETDLHDLPFDSPKFKNALLK